MKYLGLLGLSQTFLGISMRHQQRESRQMLETMQAKVWLEALSVSTNIINVIMHCHNF